MTHMITITSTSDSGSSIPSFSTQWDIPRDVRAHRRGFGIRCLDLIARNDKCRGQDLVITVEDDLPREFDRYLFARGNAGVHTEAQSGKQRPRVISSVGPHGANGLGKLHDFQRVCIDEVTDFGEAKAERQIANRIVQVAAAPDF